MEIAYFLFTLNHQLSALNAVHIEEVFALPELTLMPEAPLGIIGVLTLRGEGLPILDLSLEPHKSPPSYQITDSVMVLNQPPLRVGILVKAVHGIRELSSQGLETEVLDFHSPLPSRLKHLVAGTITTPENAETLFVFKDPQDWFSPADIEQLLSINRFWTNNLPPETPAAFFCPTWTPEEQMIGRQRAENLRRPLEAERSAAGFQTLVVAIIGGRLVGIDSQQVQEFITLRQAMPIPCCPPHIVGSLNLRGEILTVIDISQPLNLEVRPLPEAPKAIVVQMEETTAVIVVEAILDAMFALNPQDLRAVSDETLPTQANYIQGTALYEGLTMHLLNLTALLRSQELVVNELL